jgi:hypothetical protein
MEDALGSVTMVVALDTVGTVVAVDAVVVLATLELLGGLPACRAAPEDPQLVRTSASPPIPPMTIVRQDTAAS